MSSYIYGLYLDTEGEVERLKRIQTYEKDYERVKSFDKTIDRKERELDDYWSKLANYERNRITKNDKCNNKRS